MNLKRIVIGVLLMLSLIVVSATAEVDYSFLDEMTLDDMLSLKVELEERINQRLNSAGLEATTTKESAIDALSEVERKLFDALIKMDFYEPSAIRIMEVGEYHNYTKYKGEPLYGTDTVVVKLQGENRVGGTLNHYYLVCIGEADASIGNDNIRMMITATNDMSFILQYRGKVGEYAELKDGYTLKSVSKEFDVGKINNAIKEYWSNKGF